MKKAPLGKQRAEVTGGAAVKNERRMREELQMKQEEASEKINAQDSIIEDLEKTITELQKAQEHRQPCWRFSSATVGGTWWEGSGLGDGRATDTRRSSAICDHW